MPLTDDLKRFRQGNVGEKMGAAMNMTASLPRYAATAAYDKFSPSVTGFMGDVARGAGAGEMMPEARADTTRFRSPGSPHDGEPVLTDDKARKRARNDPVSGNPKDEDDFIDRAAEEAFKNRGPVEGFMDRKEGSYANGYEVTGDWGAPGSSGMPGPGGTVNTIPSEFFTNPGGRLAGDAAVGRARRDFQLRQEGNAGLASDATPEEKRVWQRQELMQDLQNLDLTNPKHLLKAKMIQDQLAGFRETDAASTARAATARENQLDRQADITQALIEHGPGSGNLKVGSTMEAIRRKMVNQGFNSLTAEENFLLTEGIREQAIADLKKENYGEPVTQDQIAQRMDLMLGQLQQAAKEAGQQGQAATDKLTNSGKGQSTLPDEAIQALDQAGPGKGIRYQGHIYRKDENGNVVKVK